MRALPGAWASDTLLGGFAIWGVIGAGIGCGCATARGLGIMVATPRFAGRGVGGYIGIFMTVLYLENLE
jgi:F0F1-type ATP synthase membrane subunit c/vacuolar-type H+-ATPase subunit K